MHAARPPDSALPAGEDGRRSSACHQPKGRAISKTVGDSSARPTTSIEIRLSRLQQLFNSFDPSPFHGHDLDQDAEDYIVDSADDFKGLAVCGGFSYGDVLGGGEGWAKSILFNARARREFEGFFGRNDTFALGSCNGCQMMAALKEIIPGAQHWPVFAGNRSAQFEARFAMVEVIESPSILLRGMAGSRMPIATAHGEGRAEFSSGEDLAKSLVSMRFVDNRGQPTETYPLNPNGSPGGITGLTTPDGRFTVVMPHPERVFRSIQMSWAPDGAGEDSPWMRMFYNAREWVG